MILWFTILREKNRATGPPKTNDTCGCKQEKPKELLAGPLYTSRKIGLGRSGQNISSLKHSHYQNINKIEKVLWNV